MLNGVENLALQGVHGRPVRLLCREKMSARGRENIDPPLPRGNTEKDGNEDGVRRKEERDFAVGETQRPGDLRGDVITDGGCQDIQRRTER